MNRSRPSSLPATKNHIEEESDAKIFSVVLVENNLGTTCQCVTWRSKLFEYFFNCNVQMHNFYSTLRLKLKLFEIFKRYTYFTHFCCILSDPRDDYSSSLSLNLSASIKQNKNTKPPLLSYFSKILPAHLFMIDLH